MLGAAGVNRRDHQARMFSPLYRGRVPDRLGPTAHILSTKGALPTDPWVFSSAGKGWAVAARGEHGSCSVCVLIWWRVARPRRTFSMMVSAMAFQMNGRFGVFVPVVGPGGDSGGEFGDAGERAAA